MLQLPKWRTPKKRPDARDRWLYFFKDGKQLDPAHPPELLRTKEMRQAMNVLADFSEKEKDYLLYEQRLEAERVELTWQEQLEQVLRESERRLQEQEREHQEKEKQLLQEKERLRALLLKAGIDPTQ
ncbi:MAG: hypothetical protein GY801_25550 [bacterium]|nr:hypothetical protein [bacterium]